MGQPVIHWQIITKNPGSAPAAGVSPRLPGPAEVRRDIRKRFEQMLLGHLWEGVSHLVELPRLIVDLDSRFRLTSAMIEQGLDEQLRRDLHEAPSDRSYSAVRDEVVERYFREFLQANGDAVQQLVNEHLHRGGGQP